MAGLILAGLATGMTVSTIASLGADRGWMRRKDWSIFEAGSGGQGQGVLDCQPATGVIWPTRGGKRVEVQRGDVFLMVAVRPGDKVKNEVSFLSGYPFKGGSKVTVSVGNKNYTMFTEGENAWTRSPAEDSTLTSAFRRGSKARVEGLSQRGTTTRRTRSPCRASRQPSRSHRAAAAEFVAAADVMRRAGLLPALCLSEMVRGFHDPVIPCYRPAP